MRFTDLDSFIDTMPKRGFPAAHLAVMRDGELIYDRCAGYSDARGEREVKGDDLYWIYSATKVITCIAAMRLVEEGRLSLSDPVSKYIPEYAELHVLDDKGQIVPAKNKMTILHLFTMTGGLTYNMRTPAIESTVGIEGDTQSFASAFVLDPLIFEPGTRYQYSLCHDVLGAVIEVVTGMRLSEYFDKLIFTPLGLTDIGFRPTEEQYERISAMYRYDVGPSSAIEIPKNNQMSMLRNYESGGGGLFSSVSDYLKIISTIATGGTTADGYRLLMPETIEMMKKNYLTDIQRTDFIKHSNFGYGWGLCGRVHIDPNVSLSLSPVGEFGWDGAAGAFSMIDTDNRLALFFATHIMGAKYIYSVVHPAIRNLVYKELL